MKNYAYIERVSVNDNNINIGGIKMLKILSETTFKDKIIKVSQQNFKDGTVEIIYGSTYHKCNMFNEDGDIGFIFKNKKFYFNELKMV